MTDYLAVEVEMLKKQLETAKRLEEIQSQQRREIFLPVIKVMTIGDWSALADDEPVLIDFIKKTLEIATKP